MTINQILAEQMKSFDYEFVITSQWQQKEWRSKYSTDFVKAFIHSYTRKLIESLAEEIVGKNIRHVTATMGEKDHTGDMDTDEVINALQDDIDAVNDYKEEQRLKVKEILSNFK